MGMIDVASDASIDVAGSVAHLVIAPSTQGNASVSVQDDAVVTTLEVKKDAGAVIQAADSATIKDIVAPDQDKITIEASTDKKQELEDQVTSGDKPASGSSGSSGTGGGHGGNSGSSGGNDTEVTGTTVSNFEELKTAAASNAVSSIVVQGTVVIDDDFQCNKPVTIAQGAMVSISDYAISMILWSIRVLYRLPVMDDCILDIEESSSILVLPKILARGLSTVWLRTQERISMMERSTHFPALVF